MNKDVLIHCFDASCWVSDRLSDFDIAAIVIDKSDKRLIYANRFSHQLFGRALESKNIDHLLEILIPQNRIENLENDHSEMRLINWGNALLSYELHVGIDNKIWFFIKDITEKTRLESIAEAMNVIDNIGYVFAGIRHEIGNPMNTIKMTLSVLKKNFEYLPKEKILSYVDRIEETLLRMEELLQSLKNYNMYDQPKPQNINIGSFFGRLIPLIEKDFREKGVRIKFFTHDSIWGYTDARALQQVLLNIITNAFDALKNTPKPEIVISIINVVGKVWIKVHDNGCGIPFEQQEHLFKPFHTTKVNGTGLGLVITRKILTKLNSSIKIQSSPGEGTVVIISIPEGRSDETKPDSQFADH